MNENLSPQFNLQELLEDKFPDPLIHLKKELTWKGLNDPDKELLALFLITRGRRLLNDGDETAFEHLEKAAEIVPNSPKTFFLLGNAYASHDEHVGCLRSALDCFDRCLNLSPSEFEHEAYVNFIRILLKKGEALNEVAYFQSAKAKCIDFFSCTKRAESHHQSEIYWLCGRSAYYIGRHYGEAVDYHEALEKFSLAAEYGQNSAEFWRDYGHAQLDQAHLLERRELFYSAAEHFQKSIKLVHDCSESWFALGLCYLYIYEYCGIKSDGVYADSCFANASKIDRNDFKIWLEWGLLLCEMGKAHNDKKLFQQSRSKFEIAYLIEPNDARLFRLWSESLMFEGAIEEDISLLKEAESKLLLSLEMQPDSCESWFIYGSLLNEFGRYFNDERYFHQGIEKFQHGIALKSDFPYLWNGLALSYFSIGDINANLDDLERAVEYCEKAIELGAGRSIQCWNDCGVALMRMAELTGAQIFVEQALEKFQSALELQENSEDPDPELLYNYGCAFDFLGDFYGDAGYYEKAIESLSRVLQIDPDYGHARYNLALALSHLGDLVMDVDCYQRALEQFYFLLKGDQEDEMVWHEYGMTLLNLGHLVYDQAIPAKSRHYFEQAEIKLMHALSLGCLQSTYALAMLYSATHNYDLAMFYLHKADTNKVLPCMEELLYEELLEPLRQTDAFQEFQNRQLKVDDNMPF